MTDPCQDPRPESYSAWIQFAEDQTAQGNEQDYCAICQRWKFPPEQCERFRVHPDNEAMKVEDA